MQPTLLRSPRRSLRRYLPSVVSGLLLAAALISPRVSADDLDIYTNPAVVVSQAPLTMVALDLNLSSANTVLCDNVLLSSSAPCGDIRGKVTVLDYYTLLGLPVPILAGLAPTALLSDLSSSVRLLAAGLLPAAMLPISQQQAYVLAITQLLESLVNSRVAVILNHSNKGPPPSNKCAFADQASLPGERQDTIACSNGAYFFVGLSNLANPLDLTTVLTKLVTGLTSPQLTGLLAVGAGADSPFQAKEIYAELVKYLRGDRIYNGHLGYYDYGDTNASNNLDSSLPPLTWDTAVEQPGNKSYQSALAAYPNACTINLVNVQLTNAAGQDDSDAELKALFPFADRNSDGMLTLPEVVDSATTDGFVYSGRRRTINSYFVIQDNLSDAASLQSAGANVTTYTDVLGLIGRGQGIASGLVKSLEVDTSVGSVSFAGSRTSANGITTAAYAPLFRPNKDQKPDWPGNLKRLQLKTDPTSKQLQLFDASNQLAIAGDGHIRTTALTLWTDSSQLGAGKTADGRKADLGGAGQKIPGYQVGGGGNPGRSNPVGSAVARKLLFDSYDDSYSDTVIGAELKALAPDSAPTRAELLPVTAASAFMPTISPAAMACNTTFTACSALCTSTQTTSNTSCNTAKTTNDALCGTNQTASNTSCATNQTTANTACSTTKTSSDTLCDSNQTTSNASCLTSQTTANSACGTTKSASDLTCATNKTTSDTTCNTAYNTSTAPCTTTKTTSDAVCATNLTASNTTCAGSKTTSDTACSTNKTAADTSCNTVRAACLLGTSTCNANQTTCLANSTSTYNSCLTTSSNTNTSCLSSASSTNTTCLSNSSNAFTTCAAPATTTRTSCLASSTSANTTCLSNSSTANTNCLTTANSNYSSCVATTSSTHTTCLGSSSTANSSCLTTATGNYNSCVATSSSTASSCLTSSASTSASCLAGSASTANTCNNTCTDNLNTCLTSVGATASARTVDTVNRELLLYARGFNVGTAASPTGTGPATSPTDSGVFSRPWMMGAVLHSRPLAINYGKRSGGTDDVRVVFGAADGYLRMVRDDTGVESWGFMPQAVMGNLKGLRENQTGSLLPYGVDGSPVVLIRDRTGNNANSSPDFIISKTGSSIYDRVLMFVGLRRGGSNYYAMDITDPDNPTLEWSIAPDGLRRKGSLGVISGTSTQFASLGLSFSTPQVGRMLVKSGGTSVAHSVLIFAGGYNGGRTAGGSKLGKDLNNSRNPTTAAQIGVDDGSGSTDRGNALFIVDAETGDLLWRGVRGTSAGYDSASTSYTHPLMVDSIPSDVTALDTNNDGIIDRLYVGDTGGRLWRADFPGSDRATWTMTPIASVGRHTAGATALVDDRRMFHAPDFVPVRNSATNTAYDVVVFGTGDREDPLNLLTENWLYAFRDTDLISGKAASEIITNEAALPHAAAFSDQTTVCASGTTNVSCKNVTELNPGYRLKLANKGEKLVSAPLTLGGATAFSTYVPSDPTDPSAPICVPQEGAGRLYNISLLFSNPVPYVNQTTSTRDVGLPAAGLPGEVTAVTGATQAVSGNLFNQKGVRPYRTSWRERLGEDEKAPSTR